MELDRYLDELRTQLLVAAEAGGEDARALAGRLTAPLESGGRLMLLEALSDAANEITLELAPGSVEVRLRGRDPELVVTPPPTDRAAADDVSLPSVAAEPDDGETARITLRLPDSLKQRVEEAAARQALSVNSWLVRAVSAAVDQRGRPAPDSTGPASVGSTFTGWVR